MAALANKQLEDWTGEFGNSYTARNVLTPENLQARIDLWAHIWTKMRLAPPRSVLEVGANIGGNLEAIRRVAPHSLLQGIEPNMVARETLAVRFKAINATAEDTGFPPDSFDLVFTSGVLIHIPPEGKSPGVPGPLHKAMAEIVRVSKRWVIAVEYFSKSPREVVYRDRKGLLWTRDFGRMYVEEFGLTPVACGFAWQVLTGLDDLTWWVLHKA